MMRRLVRQGVADRLTVESAQAIVRACPQRDARCEALKLRAWLARYFRFVRDPARQETLRPARLLLEQQKRDGVASGDCDDAAVLGASLAASIGFQPFAMVTGRRPGAPYQHVYSVLPLAPYSSGFVDLDVTRPANMPAPNGARMMGWLL